MKQKLPTKISIIYKPRVYLGILALLFVCSLSFAKTLNVASNNVALTAGNIVPENASVITGKVTDQTDGTALAGVTVTVKGIRLSAVTDVNGKFSISAESNATLVFSFVGYESVEMPVNGQAVLNVSMKPNSTNLNEVVVVGYGSQKKISLTGAVDKVSGATAVDGRPVINTTQALEGESPNLIIQQRGWVPNGGSFNINIRGSGTTGNNDPLVVIDGVIANGLGVLGTINPSDIDNISILKDAGSAAIYGSRSANGVILITTKKGKIGTKPTVTY
ncbi:MAG: carboxypeptidase-like regulatory domain-containing protein, partial [Mucilaginibacter sp.]